MSRTFDFTIQGESIKVDPFKIRRLLLEHTDGRCWRYAADLAKLAKDLEDLREQEKVSPTEELVAQISVTLLAMVKVEGILANAAMEAFEFAELNLATGEGVTEFEALEVFKKYIEYAEGKDWRSGI